MKYIEINRWNVGRKFRNIPSFDSTLIINPTSPLPSTRISRQVNGKPIFTYPRRSRRYKQTVLLAGPSLGSENSSSRHRVYRVNRVIVLDTNRNS